MARIPRLSLTTAALTAATTALAWLAPMPALSQGVESSAGAEAESSESPDEPKKEISEPVWLGVRVDEKTDGESGAAVRDIVESSPAARSDLEDDDRILDVDGKSVRDLSSLRAALSDYQPGDEIKLRVRRGDEKQKVTVTLSGRPTESELMRRQLVGTSLPNLELKDLDGNGVSPSDYRGKPLVLEFWATWCYPCRVTQKTLGTIGEKFGDRIEILGVSSEKKSVLRKYRREVDVPYSIVRDPDDSAQKQLLVSRYPTLIVVGPKGKVAEVFVGTDHREALTTTLEQMVE